MQSQMQNLPYTLQPSRVCLCVIAYTYIHTYMYSNDCSVVTDAMKMKRLESERDRIYIHTCMHTYIHTYIYSNDCSVVTDAMKMKRLESERDLYKQKAEETSALMRELEELKKAQGLQALKVGKCACYMCVCMYVHLSEYMYMLHTSSRLSFQKNCVCMCVRMCSMCRSLITCCVSLVHVCMHTFVIYIYIYIYIYTCMCVLSRVRDHYINLYMYVCICGHHMYLYVSPCLYLSYIYTYTYMPTHTSHNFRYLCTHICLCVNPCMYVPTHMCSYMYVCMYVCVC
jgi:hypothetical protein